MANPINLATLFREQIGGRRNLVINGAMQVAQRGASETGITGTGYRTVDRFNITILNQGTWTITQEDVTDLPGFSNSLKVLCTTAAPNPVSGAAVYIRTSLEGQDLQHLKKGTSDAESITFSFWVKSNKTGTYIVEVLGRDTSPQRHINKTFTVNTSGTWEYKTLTFEGDTTGTIDNDNGAGLSLSIWLGSGSNYNSGTLQTSWGDQSNTDRAVGNVNLADATSNYFEITGVQLEVGETATPFEHRSFGEELALCQRYYFRPNDSGVQDDGSAGQKYGLSTMGLAFNSSFTFPVKMRAAPSATLIPTTIIFDNCDANTGIILNTNPDGYISRVNVTSNAPYRAYNWLYEFKAEL